MIPDTLTEEIMSYIRYRTELLHLPLTVQQYNAVYEGVHEWIYESGEKLKQMLADPFKGKIPPIAEKEKRGKRVKIPPSEIYVQEITTKESKYDQNKNRSN